MPSEPIADEANRNQCQARPRGHPPTPQAVGVELEHDVMPARRHQAAEEVAVDPQRSLRLPVNCSLPTGMEALGHDQELRAGTVATNVQAAGAIREQRCGAGGRFAQGERDLAQGGGFRVDPRKIAGRIVAPTDPAEHPHARQRIGHTGPTPIAVREPFDVGGRFAPSDPVDGRGPERGQAAIIELPGRFQPGVTGPVPARRNRRPDASRPA